jgi:hypothetical protein
MTLIAVRTPHRDVRWSASERLLGGKLKPDISIR